MSTVIFFHIAIMNNYQSIVDEIVEDISVSGLYDVVDGINVGIVGGNSKAIKSLPDKYTIKFESSNLKLYEKPTLTLLYDHATSTPGNVLYVHTKNARTVPIHKQSDYKRWKSWSSREVHRKYMLNFMVYKYADRLGELDTHDAVGCDFRNHPENSSHFAGNFWWARNSFIKTLPSWHEPRFLITGPMGKQPRHYCERWLLCYNNKDNEHKSPNYKTVFYGAECRKNDGIIDNILSKTKQEVNRVFDDLLKQQIKGQFPIRI